MMTVTDPRKKVEATFEKWIPDEDGCLVRSDFIDMLIMLGLCRKAAEELLNVLDPKSRDRLPYKEFLDFIFLPAEQPEAHSAKVESNVEPTKKVSDDGKVSPPKDLNKDPSPGLSDSQTTKASEGAETIASTSDGAPSSDTTVDSSKTAESMKPVVDPETFKQCSQCLVKGADVFQDCVWLENYCPRCWELYCENPEETVSNPGGLPEKLVTVFPGKIWNQSNLSRRWMQMPIPGWPPYASPTPAVKDAQAVACPPSGDPADIPPNPGQNWVDVRVRVIPNLIGTHARECTRNDRPRLREVLSGRYQVEGTCGAGHFTRAFRATDLITKKTVCVKRHNSLTVEILTDMMAIGQRLQKVDPDSEFFPRLVDQFFDMSGYTVEEIIEGKNCLDMRRENPRFFMKMSNLRHVAKGSLNGLALLAQAGIVHADLKPDNIMWSQPSTPDGDPVVRIVDFGCARLDSRNENGRNWALSEGGAGHLGKWAPEMALRIPITAKADIWGLAVSLLELHSGRAMWCDEDDTIEDILAQALGLLNARDGLPQGLLRRSPVDITRLYSPAPAHFPCRRITDDADPQLEEMRPAAWGLAQILGPQWNDLKSSLSDFVIKAMEMDPEKRPSAQALLKHHFIIGPADKRTVKEPEKPKAEAPADQGVKRKDPEEP